MVLLSSIFTTQSLVFIIPTGGVNSSLLLKHFAETMALKFLRAEGLALFFVKSSSLLSNPRHESRL